LKLRDRRVPREILIRKDSGFKKKLQSFTKNARHVHQEDQEEKEQILLQWRNRLDGAITLPYGGPLPWTMDKGLYL